MHSIHSGRAVAAIGTFLMAIMLSCGSCPTEPEPLVSMEGLWQELFLVPMVGVVQIDGNGGDVDMFDTLRVLATMTMQDGQFSAETDRPVSMLPQYHQPPPLEGTYRVHGDTITFSESSNVLSAQDFSFELQQDSLKLSYLGVTDTLESGATIMVVPAGCLPWHNAWMKRSGTFHRLE